jgi:glucose-1-phosphate cytidylyltransferase
MKIYSHFGIRHFVICLGYKGYMIKEYFANYFLHQSDVTIEMGGEMTFHSPKAEPWRVTLIDTGANTMTGGRLKRVQEYLPQDRPFFMTYGDGVADIAIDRLLDFHQSHGKQATVTAVRPMARFGALDIEGDAVRSFKEKPFGEGGYINGGFFVLAPAVLDLIENDATVWEQQPLQRLAASDNLRALQHDGFWQPMDTLRDRFHLEDLWANGQAKWRVW